MIEVDETMEIIRHLKTYKESVETILDKLGLELDAVRSAINVSNSYNSNVILIPRFAQDELNVLHTEAVESDYEIGAILYWLMFRNENNKFISILTEILQCENTSFNPRKSYNPDYRCLIDAIYNVVSGEYDAFTILHSHTSDSFISCCDLVTKTYSDIKDTLDLYGIWKNYMAHTDISKSDIDLIYKMYSALPDIMLAGGISNYAILFNTYGYSTNTYVVTYYDIDHSYIGKVHNLCDYLNSKKYEEPYFLLYDYYKRNCYTAFKMAGFSVMQRRVINGKVFYALIRL